jgi:DnaJ-class molecular chaperone
MTVILWPGQVAEQCKRCSGLGEVIVRVTPMPKYEVCPSCGGGGWVVWTRGVSLTPLIPRRL